MCKLQARGRSKHISYKLFCIRLKKVNLHAGICKISACGIYAGIAAYIYVCGVKKLKNLFI